MYGAKRKFMFGFHSEFSHSDNSRLKKVWLVKIVKGGGGGGGAATTGWMLDITWERNDVDNDVMIDARR